ncbi:MAG TPA: hypothetical protein VHT51_18745 [Micropepsaceae bacterium]|jgi:hypothetical protein|nr:hypothetical protein [Micropepsaceae bacterium]
MRMGRPLQKALGEVIRHIGLQTPVIVVVGSAGTGKTLLVDMTVRACADMGLTARRADTADQVHALVGTKSDVVLIDQTDSMSNSSLQTLLSPEGKNTATTMVFMCLPTCVGQIGFAAANRATIELTPLSLSDARNYLHERAVSIGRTNLFSPEALDLVIDGSRGLPRLLRSIAHLAYWAAASENAPQIGAQHVSNAAGSPGIETDGDVTGPQLVAKAPSDFGIATKPNDGLAEMGERVVNVSEIAGNTAIRRDERVSGTLLRKAAETKSPSVAAAQQPAMKKNVSPARVEELPQREERQAGIWIPRIAGGLAATAAIGVVLSMTFMGGAPVSAPNITKTPVAAAIPARPKSTVASASKPATNTAAIAKAVKVASPKATAATSRPTVKAAVQTPRENPVVEQASATKPVDDKLKAEADSAHEIATVGEKTPNVASETQKTAPSNQAGEQTAAPQPTEEQAAAARAAKERENAAVQAFLLTQEAARKAQAARDAAAREQAEKDAAARAMASQQKAKRQFSNSLFGVGG